eukprot:jgi/Galph1/3372/GphlegSOOS_G2011.1
MNNTAAQTRAFLPSWTHIKDSSVFDKSFTIVSYNVLAQVYVNTLQFPYCPRKYLRKKYRESLTKTLLEQLDVDIICLQEVDNYEEIERYLKEKGYQGIFKNRSGTKKDGCAIFFKDKFQLCADHSWDCDQITRPEIKQYFHKDWNQYLETRHKRSNVGLCIALKWLDKDNVPYYLFIANIHLFWNPIHEDVKLLQTLQAVYEIREFMDRFERTLEIANNTTDLVLVGDFNSCPETVIYQFLTNGQVDLSEVSLMNGNDYWETWKEGESDWTSQSTGEGLATGSNNFGNVLPSKPIFAENILISSPFVFQSAVSAVVGKELKWTNRTAKFTETIDYIFYIGKNCKPVQMMPTPEDIDNYVDYLPNENLPSDHIPLGIRFQWLDSK